MPAPAPPDSPRARQIRHYARSRAWCEWEEFDNRTAQVQADIGAAGKTSDTGDAGHTGAARPAPWPPFHLLSVPGISAHQQRQCATTWLDERLPPEHNARSAAISTFSTPARPRQPGAPLRIAYLSSDFHQHATALLMIEMLEAHDGSRFELHAYSHGALDDSPMRHRLLRAFHHFHDIRELSDEQAASAIHADGVDILVDLKGYTAGSRTMLLSWRPAPIQVSFLGYPGTLGRDFVDYLVSDRFVTPHAAQPDYTEALACMPHSYQPHGRASLPGHGGPTRSDVGLPEGALVLSCFNQAWKFTPQVFDIWCRVMRAVPHSVLWLLRCDQAEGNLRQEALARGISPHRLVFAPDMQQEAHLARLPLADLVLDTWPYNAHTTASDALAAGVPLITCAGDTFASRVAGSLLQAVGLPELITSTPADYEALALALATDADRLRGLRAKLGGLICNAALFDVPGYTQDLEALFDLMWARHRAGLPPAALDL